MYYLKRLIARLIEFGVFVGIKVLLVGNKLIDIVKAFIHQNLTFIIGLIFIFN